MIDSGAVALVVGSLGLAAGAFAWLSATLRALRRELLSEIRRLPCQRPDCSRPG